MMTDPQDRPGDAGSTLVEVLISMFIFSLISIGALFALTATLDAREASEARMAEIEQLAAARRLMADDFAMMTVRRNRDGLGGFTDAQRASGRMDRIELTRRARPNPDGTFARGDMLRLSWRVENGQLIRAFLPHENPAYVERPRDRVVLDGVDALSWTPLFPDDGASADSRWIGGSDLSDRAILIMDAVAVTLTHSDGTITEHLFEIPEIGGASGA